MTPEFDVAIVGYGPVGQALAILLGTRGWRVGVFEKRSAAYPMPRAVHFDHEAGRILQALGVAEELSEHTESADTYEWRNAAGETLLRFGSKATGVSGWPDANMFTQPHLERLLDARARSIATVSVQRGAEVVGVTASDAMATLTIAAADGDRRELRARYVVGCDGARSFVRQALGATVTDLGFFFDWLIVDVLPHRPSVWSPLNLQICDPRRPTTLVSGGRGRRRWEFMCLPDERIEDFDSEASAWRLLEPWGVTPDNATLERHAVYRFQARWVDTWRRGRLLLAGDAAHQMPPFAGQGLCSGLRDAANLAWKLELVLAGRAPAALLDTYAEERVPHVRTLIDFSMELGKVICIADPNAAAMRDQTMVAAAQDRQSVPPPPPLALGGGVLRDGDPHAGGLFVQGRVAKGDVVGRFDDVVGRGWALLSASGNPADHLTPEAAEYYASLGGIAVHVGGPELQDLDGTYARWFENAGVAVVLQRPDFYLFGSAASLAESAALVGALRTKLGPS